MSSDDEERTFALTVRVKAPLRSALRAEADRRSKPGARSSSPEPVGRWRD